MQNEKLAEQILEIALKNNPQTVEELIRLVQEVSEASEEQIFSCVMKLQEKGKFTLELSMEKEEVPPSFARFLASTDALWYWTTVFSSSFLLIVIFLFGNNQTMPYILVRQILGGAFVILYPGFSFVKAIFPGRKMSYMEILVFSLAFSFSFTAIVGFMLNYTPLGVKVESTVSSLYALILLFSCVGIAMEYSKKRK